MSTANDNAEAFELENAKQIIEQELKSVDVEDVVISILLHTLSQDFTGKGVEKMCEAYLSEVGLVSVKVQNPALKEKVKKEAELLKNVAAFANIFNKFMKSKYDGPEPVGVMGRLTSTVFEQTDSTIRMKISRSNFVRKM